MNSNGPIIIIEDDVDDQYLFTEVYERLGYNNEVIFFLDGEKALHYLNDSHVVPFLILSDINMPKMDGFGLRSQIQTNEQLEMKCIPYLFFSTAANQKDVVNAYSMSVQGFFTKKNTVAELEKTIKVIMDYWKRCIAPNDF